MFLVQTVCEKWTVFSPVDVDDKIKNKYRETECINFSFVFPIIFRLRFNIPIIHQYMNVYIHVIIYYTNNFAYSFFLLNVST